MEEGVGVGEWMQRWVKRQKRGEGGKAREGGQRRRATGRRQGNLSHAYLFPVLQTFYASRALPCSLPPLRWCTRHSGCPLPCQRVAAGAEPEGTPGTTRLLSLVSTIARYWLRTPFDPLQSSSVLAASFRLEWSPHSNMKSWIVYHPPGKLVDALACIYATCPSRPWHSC